MRSIGNICIVGRRRPHIKLSYDVKGIRAHKSSPPAQLKTCLVILLGMVVAACGGAADTPVLVPSNTSDVVSFNTSDGIRLEGRLFGQSQTGVVLAHMFPADQSSWWNFAQELDEEGYMALTFDFRGYGGSGGDQDIKLIDRDVEAAFEFLGEQGARAVFLAGASMGGTASLKLAARQAVSGVISLSAPIEFKGLSLEDEQVQVPVLLLASQGDRGATKSVNDMINEGIVGGPELVRRVVFEEGNDHGTDILEGKVAASAREEILSFLQEYRP